MTEKLDNPDFLEVNNVLNGFSGDFKKLKTRLHFKFIRYIDLFTIFWLILQKKLKIQNLTNFHILQQFLNPNTPNLNNSNVNNNVNNVNNSINSNVNSIGKEFEELDWSVCIERFIENVKKFHINKSGLPLNSRSLPLEKLTFTDFDSCNITIKREPFGLISTIHNTYRVNNTYSGDTINTINNITHDYSGKSMCSDIKKLLLSTVNSRQISSCEIKSKSVLVGVISPFILNSHELLVNKFKPVRTPGTDEGYDKKWAYKINQQLYTSHKYPLNSFFNNTIDSINSIDSMNSVESVNSVNSDESVRISDLLCDIIFNILDHSNDLNDLHYQLIGELRHNLGELVTNTMELPNNTLELPSNNVELDDLEYEKVLMRASELKPFPTIYWLMNKDLISRVSELEGKGLIKDIQSTINSIIQQITNSNCQINEQINSSDDKNDEKINNSNDKITEKNNNFDDKNNEKDKLECENLISLLILDNIFYTFRRFQFTHPTLIQSFYNYFINSTDFTLIKSSQSSQNYQNYINLTNSITNLNNTITNSTNNNNLMNNNLMNSNDDCINLSKGLSIVNTLRRYGIGGSDDFFHIKCLHTHLAYHITESSIIGSLITQLLN